MKFYIFLGFFSAKFDELFETLDYYVMVKNNI